MCYYSFIDGVSTVCITGSKMTGGNGSRTLYEVQSRAEYRRRRLYYLYVSKSIDLTLLYNAGVYVIINSMGVFFLHGQNHERY